MSNSIPTQLRFSPFAGFTVRADFEGGALTSDFGPLLLRGNAHFANMEFMQLAFKDPYTDFLFDLTGNRRLKKLAKPYLTSTRQSHDTRCHNARLAAQLAHFPRAGLSGPLLAVGLSHRPESRSHGLGR